MKKIGAIAVLLLEFAVLTVQAQAAEKIANPAQKAPAHQSGKMLDGILIRHFSWVNGDEEFAITPQFIAIFNPSRTGVFVSKMPFTSVVAYDSAKRTYYETKPEAAGSFMVQRFMKLLGGDPHPKNWKKVEDGVVAGVKAGRYVVDSSKHSVTLSDETGEKILSEMRVDGFWAAEDLKIPPGAANIVAKMEGFPTIGKLPLYMAVPKKEKSKKPRIATYSVTKKKFPESLFVVPTGYHKGDAEYSLQTDELELFGGSDPLGTSKQKK